MQNFKNLFYTFFLHIDTWISLKLNKKITKMDDEMGWYFVMLQSKDEEKSSQKSGPESSIVADELRVAADQDEQSCAGSLEVSTNRSGSTSERRVTRASARSQQQRGRSSVDGTIQICCVINTKLLQWSQFVCRNA